MPKRPNHEQLLSSHGNMFDYYPPILLHYVSNIPDKRTHVMPILIFSQATNDNLRIYLKFHLLTSSLLCYGQPVKYSPYFSNESSWLTNVSRVTTHSYTIVIADNSTSTCYSPMFLCSLINQYLCTSTLPPIVSPKPLNTESLYNSPNLFV
jgi:hypothetical protein